MKTIINQVIINPFSDVPFTCRASYKKDDDREVDLTTARAVRDFLQAGFNQSAPGVSAPTMKDSLHTLRVLKQVRKLEKETNGTFKLEDADFDWLITSLESRGTLLFGVNAQVVLEAVKETVADES